MANWMLAVAGCLTVSACTSQIEGGGTPRCTDPKYGNGTCDVETSCGAPDIDCFTTFETQADAQAWYTARPANPTSPAAPAVPASDARFAKMKMLLDQGWEAYKATRDVGDLANHQVQLVLVDPPQLNLAAFVAPDAGGTKAALAVFVELPLIDGMLTDNEVIGIMMHELEHAIGLHVVAAVKQRFSRYYAAGATEPLGFEQTDAPAVRAHVEQWRSAAADYGYLADPELVGLPYGGALGKAFTGIVVARNAAAPAACAASVTQLGQLLDSVTDAVKPLDGSVNLAASSSTTILDVVTKLRDECFVGVTGDAITHVASFYKADEAALRASLSADLRSSIEGKSFVVGIYNWVQKGRAALRALEMASTTATGASWNQLRYYSTEEAADDSAVVSLEAMGLSAASVTSGLIKLQTLEAMCNPLVDGNQPIPYGENVDDDHHATCWRAGHAKAVAASGLSVRIAEKAPLGVDSQITPLIELPDPEMPDPQSTSKQ